MIKNIKNSQLQNLLSAISKLNSDIAPETLPERTISAVSEIVSSDIISFDGFSLNTEFLVAENWHNPPQTISSDLLEVLAEHFAEHPFVEHIQNRLPNAVRISDFVSVKEFHQRAIFNEFYKKVDVTHQLSVCLPVANEGVMTCTINRDGMDFSESERDLLTLMSGHLTSAIRNASVFENFQRRETRLKSVLERNRQGIVVINPDGKIVQTTEYAEKLLEEYFPHGKTRGLPDEVKDWMKSYTVDFEIAITPPPAFVIKKKASELRIKLILNSQNKDRTLLFEEKCKPQPEGLTALGLTEREAEILFLISIGKTNSEIAILCRISPRTVHKHTEHIFVKLGVENRTAAAMRVTDFFMSIYLFLCGLSFAAEF